MVWLLVVSIFVGLIGFMMLVIGDTADIMTGVGVSLLIISMSAIVVALVNTNFIEESIGLPTQSQESSHAAETTDVSTVVNNSEMIENHTVAYGGI